MKKQNEMRYGAWIGNEKGDPENIKRCRQRVYNRIGGILDSQCSRKRGYGTDGQYCKQHSDLPKGK